MEEILRKMDGHLDEASKKMMQHLIEKKLKYDHFKNTHFFLLALFILYCLTLLFFSYTWILVPNNYSLMNSITEFLQSSAFLLFFLIGALLFGALKIFFDKKEKAEAEFHDLRCEMIEKSPELWNENHWTNRHRIFEEIKKRYDINLYHESK